MNVIFFNFLKRLIIFSIIIGIAAFAAMQLLPASFVTNALPFLIPFFFAITLIIHYLTFKSSEKNPRRFISYFMLTIFIKLFLYIAVLLLYVFSYTNDAIPFTITFFILYILYTTFEVTAMLSYSNRQKK